MIDKMNRYHPNIHHRRSIRLKGYDYSQAGLYFVTICCQDRACVFGDVVNGEMILNDAGRMVEKWYYELENKYADKRCDEMIVMPNHFHCIIENVPSVGADLCVRPYDDNVQPDIPGVQNLSGQPDIPGEHVGSPDISGEHVGSLDRSGEHVGSPLHRAVQWFKTMTTNAYIRGVKNLGWIPFDRKLWQRNYYEHIIRDGQSYQRISEYIINNPAKWQDDKFYKP